jgi:cytochrome c peroxidase
MRGRHLLWLLWMVVVGPVAENARAQDADPPEVAIGERLFLETRFAEVFARFLRETPDATVNDSLPAGDPVLDESETTGTPLPGPFAGQSMNCRSCHLVDEQLDVPGGGMRTYADFARRSPVPAREDARTLTPRNSPPLVNASLPRRGGLVLHFDAEFDSLPSLVAGTIAGRNYGWLAGERLLVVAHVARVVREDDGSGDLAAEFGGAYRDVLSGAASVPEEFLLPQRFRVDVDSASDEEIFRAVAELISAYVEQLEFARDERGANNGSPYDRFLERNRIPRKPSTGQPVAAYTETLRAKVSALRKPVFVDEGPFAFHDQRRVFGPLELEGLRIFLARPGPGGKGWSVGNCAACHPAPDFTDFGLHNTGVTQIAYDGIHGAGAFAALSVPNLAERRRNPDRWLPATELHPNAAEPFRRAEDPAEPRYTDLGAWNIFANPDFPGAQAELTAFLCRPNSARSKRCAQAPLLEASLARFKTAGLRDLGHSAPYFHTGQFERIDLVLGFYRDAAQLARDGKLRNEDPEIARIAISDRDFTALTAFLRALNEDYE